MSTRYSTKAARFLSTPQPGSFSTNFEKIFSAGKKVIQSKVFVAMLNTFNSCFLAYLTV